MVYLTDPLTVREEGSDVCHDEAQAVQDTPGNDDPLQPCPAFIYRAAAAGEVHQKQSNGCSHNSGNGGDQKNLTVHILHDLICLGPDGGRGSSRGCINRITAHGHHNGTGKRSVGGLSGSNRGVPLFSYRCIHHLQSGCVFQ